MSSSPQTITSGNTHAVVFNATRYTLDSPLSLSSYEDVHTGSATAVQNCAEFCKDTCAPCIVQQNSRRRSMIAVIVLLLMPGLALCATPPCFIVSDEQTQHGLMTQASFVQQESQHGPMNHGSTLDYKLQRQTQH